MAVLAQAVSDPHNEQRQQSFASLYPSASSHIAANAGDRVGRSAGFQAVAAVGTTAGGLPHHSGANALPRCQPRGDGANRLSAAGAAVRPDGRAAAHEQHQRSRSVDCHAAVWPGASPGHCRAASAGSDQCRRVAAACRLARPTGVCQGQPGRCTGFNAGHHLKPAAADRGAKPGQYPAGPENQPSQRRGAGHAQRGSAACRADSGGHPCAGVLWFGAGRVSHRDNSRERQRGQGQH